MGSDCECPGILMHLIQPGRNSTLTCITCKYIKRNEIKNVN